MANTEPKESLVIASPVALAAPGYGLGYGAEVHDNYRVHLRDYWQAIRKHLWLITGLTLLTTALVTVVLLRKPNLYEAQALVQVDLEEHNPALGAAAKNSPVVVNHATNDPAYFNTQLRILSSAGLLRRVVKTLDLENNPSFLTPLVSLRNWPWYQSLRRWVGAKADWEQKEGEAEAPLTVVTTNHIPATIAPDASMLEEARRLSPYVKEMLTDLKVEPVVERRLGYARDSTRLIEIGFTHRDADLAAKVVNSIADTFVLLNLERRAETNVSTGDFLQKRVAELQAQIRSSEERLINYARNHQILSLNPEQNTVVERLVGLNRQLLEAENKRKLAEAALQAAQTPGAASALAEEHAARQVTEMETRLAEARQRHAQLLVENTEEWPEVKETKQQINVLQEDIKQARQRSTSMTLKNFETQYQQSFAAERALRKAFDQQRAETLTQNEAAINYRIIQQEIETNKNMLDGLLQRYKENDVVLAGLRNNIHIIDYAVTPDRPIGPRRLQGVVLALLFSLVFSAGLAVFLEYLNNTVRLVEDAERLLHLPVLVTVPTSQGLRRGKAQTELFLETDTGSAVAESFRQLRTSVLLSTPGHAPRRLLVTSSMPSEGKTTTAVNLALSLAQTGARVLLIDADMRRPQMRSLFKLDNRSGLSTYLASDAGPDALRGLIQRHGKTQLHVLGAGPTPPNPAELLGATQMTRLLRTLETHFTHIVIDTPPAATFTDAVVLSAQMDGVLLVARSGKTPRAALLRTRQLLAGAGAKIFGVVLNQVHARDYSYHGADYYHYAGKGGALSDGWPTTPPAPPDIPSSSSLAPLAKNTPDVEFVQLDSGSMLFTERPDTETIFQKACADFNSPAPRAHVAAARALHALGSDALARAMREVAPANRRRIGEAIAASGLAQDAIQHLTRAHNDNNFDDLQLLMTMMKAGESAPLLQAVKDHPDEAVRVSAVQVLALSQQAETLAALHQLAVDETLPVAVRTALLEAVYPAGQRS